MSERTCTCGASVPEGVALCPACGTLVLGSGAPSTAGAEPTHTTWRPIASTPWAAPPGPGFGASGPTRPAPPSRRGRTGTGALLAWSLGLVVLIAGGVVLAVLLTRHTGGDGDSLPGPPIRTTAAKGRTTVAAEKGIRWSMTCPNPSRRDSGSFEELVGETDGAGKVWTCDVDEDFGSSHGSIAMILGSEAWDGHSPRHVDAEDRADGIRQITVDGLAAVETTVSKNGANLEMIAVELPDGRFLGLFVVNSIHGSAPGDTVEHLAGSLHVDR